VIASTDLNRSIFTPNGCDAGFNIFVGELLCGDIGLLTVVKQRATTQILAEQFLNNGLQMGSFGATEGFVTLAKQMKIGLCE
jgi:hypothetical protein